MGIGGHIASTDGEHGDDVSYESGMKRELAEEVAIGGDWTSRCVDLINDDATPVGSVHLGIVHIMELERPEVCSRESELVECEFDTLDALLADRERFETGVVKWGRERLFPQSSPKPAPICIAFPGLENRSRPHFSFFHF